MLKKLDWVKVIIGLAVGIALSEISITTITNITRLYKKETRIVTKIIKIEETKPTYNYLKSITVLIKGKKPIVNESGKLTFRTVYLGTGVVIKVTDKYTYILTNEHIANSKYVQFIQDKGEDVRAKIIKVSDLFDLGLLRIRGKLTDKRAVKGIALSIIGEKVYMVGHHLGIPFIYDTGNISGYYGLNMIVSLPVMWGNSGSGVINKDGKLVGLIFALPVVFKNGFPVCDVAHGIAVDSISIVSFLNSIPELGNFSLIL